MPDNEDFQVMQLMDLLPIEASVLSADVGMVICVARTVGTALLILVAFNFSNDRCVVAINRICD